MHRHVLKNRCIHQRAKNALGLYHSVSVCFNQPVLGPQIVDIKSWLTTEPCQNPPRSTRGRQIRNFAPGCLLHPGMQARDGLLGRQRKRKCGKGQRESMMTEGVQSSEALQAAPKREKGRLQRAGRGGRGEENVLGARKGGAASRKASCLQHSLTVRLASRSAEGTLSLLSSLKINSQICSCFQM